MAVSKQVADAYKNHFGVDVIGDTVESPILPSGSAEAIISPSKIGAEAVQSTKKVPPIEMPQLPTFSSVSKSAFTPQGNTEYDPSQGVGYDYTKQSKLLSDTELQDAIRKQDIKDSGAYSPSPSEPMKALNTELSSRNAEKQRIIDQNDMLKRKLNFQARQKELGVSALDEAASYVGTSKFTDMTGVDYLNPLFYAAKAADTVVTAHKAVAQGAISAVGNLGAAIDLNARDTVVGDFGAAVSDYAKIIKQKYPQLNPSKNIGGWEDPEFYVKGISEMVPNLLGGMAASMVGAAVGGAATVNPLGAVAGGIAGAISFGYAMESGNIYDDLLTRGYSPHSAELGSKAYSAIAALPEAFFHIRGIGSAIVHPMMEEVLKKGMQAELKQTLFTGAKELVKKGVKKSGGVIVEGTTEAMQQFAQNTITKFYDKNQNIFDGLAESFVFGMGSGAVVEAGQNFGQRDINKEVVTSLQTEKALKQASIAAEQLQKTYPKDKDIAGLVLKTKTELQNAQVQTKILDAQFIQQNTTQVVKNEVLDATVSKNIDGKFISTFDANVDGQNVTFVSQELHPTEQAAQLEVAQKTQDWLTQQVDSGAITNIEQATQLNDTLKEIISPKVENPIVENPAISETIAKAPSLVDQFKKYSNNRIEKDKNNKFNAGRNTKAFGMQDSAIIRNIKGEPTSIEIKNITKYLESNYKGKKVKIGDLNGTVVGTAFGKIRVDMGNGVIKSVPIENITKNKVTVGDAVKYLQNEAVQQAKAALGDSFIPLSTSTIKTDNLEAKNTKIIDKQKKENDTKVEPKVSEKTTPTKEVKSEKKVTRFAERMKEQFKELASPEEYKAYKMNEEIDKASKIIEKDEKKAYSIAMGYTESNPEEMSFTNQTMIKKAIDEGNIDLANSLITHLSKEGTKAGQLIVSLKAMSQGYSAEKYMMDVLKTRTALANKKLGSFKDTFQNIKDAISGKTNTKVQKEVKARAKKAELTIEQKRQISIEKAKKFISDLQCK